jgi:copper(I)-binding protein
MPDGMTVYNALVQAQSPAAALVQQQAIYLMQPKTRESVWAVEAKATTQGGMIVTNNGVETVTAAEAKKRLGQ